MREEEEEEEWWVGTLTVIAVTVRWLDHPSHQGCCNGSL